MDRFRLSSGDATTLFFLRNICLLGRAAVIVRSVSAVLVATGNVVQAVIVVVDAADRSLVIASVAAVEIEEEAGQENADAPGMCFLSG